MESIPRGKITNTNCDKALERIEKISYEAFRKLLKTLSYKNKLLCQKGTPSNDDLIKITFDNL